MCLNTFDGKRFSDDRQQGLHRTCSRIVKGRCTGLGRIYSVAAWRQAPGLQKGSRTENNGIHQVMADNYLEKKMEAFQARKAKEQRAKQIAWKKRMDAYRKRLEEQKASEEAAADAACATAPEDSAL